MKRPSRRTGAWDVAAALAASPPAGWLVGVLERADRAWPPNRLAVLTYHRVDEPTARPDLYPGLISATPARFERQVRYLAERASVVSIDDLLRARRGLARLPDRAVLLTFDDAYRDFAEQAWPIVRRHGLPATLFVPTAYPGDPGAAFWWDRLYAALACTDRRAPLETPLGRLSLATTDERRAAFLRARDWLKSLPHREAMERARRLVAELNGPAPRPAILDWPSLRRLAAEGVTLAPHTRTHPLLPRLPASELAAEIAGSLADLIANAGSAAPVFAYPSGSHSPAAVAAVAEAGLEAAFTTTRGVNDLGAGDWLRLRRINVGRRTSLHLIRIQLLTAAARAGRDRPRAVPRAPIL